MATLIAMRTETNLIALNTPTFVEFDNIEGVTITRVDTNHCPGAVMYASSAFFPSGTI